jgi:HAE1 family hydrophobic/amphiphilic exporter-1
MLAARWIKPHKKTERRGSREGDAATAEPDSQTETSSKGGRFYRPIDRSYMWMLRWSMAHRWIIVVICLVAVAAIWPLYNWVG